MLWFGRLLTQLLSLLKAKFPNLWRQLSLQIEEKFPRFLVVVYLTNLSKIL